MKKVDLFAMVIGISVVVSAILIPIYYCPPTVDMETGEPCDYYNDPL